YTDMNHRDRGPILWNLHLSFPLERLHALLSRGIWSDEKSEAAWASFYPAFPYQLWNAHPNTGAHLHLQDVQLKCPWCSEVGMIDIYQFAKTHITKKSISRCSLCNHAFNADSLSAKY